MARKTASSSARAAASTWPSERPKRTEGCARSARNERGVNSIAASRMSLASAPAGLCPSVRPAESSTSTPQRASSAETRRAIDGSGVTRAAVLPGVSSVSRIAIASARRLLVLVVGDDDGDALKRGGEGQRRQRPPAFAPEIGRFGGTKRLAQESGARGERGRGRAERRHVLALDADFADQPMQQRLRMAGERLRSVVLARRSSPRCDRRD